MDFPVPRVQCPIANVVGTLHLLLERLQEAEMRDTIRYTLAAAIAIR